MNRDTVVGIVGAIVLVGAMVAVFQYERTVGAARAGIGTDAWTLAKTHAADLAGSTGLGATTEETVALNATGMTNVTFVLTWTGQSTNTLALSITPPDGVPGGPFGDGGDSGRLEIVVPVPNARPAAGAAPGALGVGDWGVAVAFESATSTTPSPLPPTGQDASVDWDLEVHVEAWAQGEA